MYAGDEFYGDDVTSGPATDEPRIPYRDTWTVVPCRVEGCEEPATRYDEGPVCAEHAL